MWGLVGVIAVVGFAIYFGARDRPAVLNPETDPSRFIAPTVPDGILRRETYAQGVEVELVGPKEGLVTLCSNESVYDEYKSRSRRFVLGEEIFGVDPGILAVVLLDKGNRLQVRILGRIGEKGGWKDRIGWIAADEVRLPPTPEVASIDLVEALTLDKRRQIYGELHRVGMLASFEAGHRFPFDDSPTDPSEASDFLAGRKAFYEARKKKGRASLSAKYKIDAAHLDRIEQEGAHQRWPMPIVPDPYKP